MARIATGFGAFALLVVLTVVAHSSFAQESVASRYQSFDPQQQPITLQFGDSLSAPELDRTGSTLRSLVNRYFSDHLSWPDVDSNLALDSTKDSIVMDISVSGFRRKHREPHVFVLSEIDDARQTTYHEPFHVLDFNRVTGFFLGIGTGTMQDFGPHDELGSKFAVGYGFASKRWEYLWGAEFRLPLADVAKLEADTASKKRVHTPPTLAVGGEIHNITSTEDAWRAGRAENSMYAFFAREDFRDYFKLAGYNAYIALRPHRGGELRVEWRSDHYEALDQNVFYGRFGGNKVLPPNPRVPEGRMNSFVVTAQRESAHTLFRRVANIFGDSVSIEQLAGMSSVLQAEFGHMPGSDFGFNKFLLDTRRFWPIVAGISFDTRLRFEAETGDVPFQKLSFVGGPGSLPALYRKILPGNRMLLFNTELRLSPTMLSSWFDAPDFNVVIYNDFAKIGVAALDQNILEGFHFNGASSILYNVGVGIGWTSGLQFGVTWRTDVKEDPRFIFRLERPF